MHRTRMRHNKKLAGLVLDNDINVPKLPHELLSNGGPSGGVVPRVQVGSASWGVFVRAKTNWDHPGSKVCAEQVLEKGVNLFSTSV